MYEDRIDQYFDTLSDDRSQLYVEYETNPNGKTYVEWLESLVMRYRK